jgi:hypothetical protein
MLYKALIRYDQMLLLKHSIAREMNQEHTALIEAACAKLEVIQRFSVTVRDQAEIRQVACSHDSEQSCTLSLEDSALPVSMLGTCESQRVSNVQQEMTTVSFKDSMELEQFDSRTKPAFNSTSIDHGVHEIRPDKGDTGQWSTIADNSLESHPGPGPGSSVIVLRTNPLSCTNLLPSMF